MSSSQKPVPNFSLPSHSESFTLSNNNLQQPHRHPLTSYELPPPLPAKSPLRLRTTKSLPILGSLLEPKLEPHPHPLRSSPPKQPFARPPSSLLTFPQSPPSTATSAELDDSYSDSHSILAFARRRLLEENSGHFKSTEIRHRIGECNGKIPPALPPTSPAPFVELNSAHFLGSLSRSDQRARVGDPHRRRNLLPSEPAGLVRKKLKERVIERRRLQRQEEAGKGHPRRAMSTLRALMLNGNKQAQFEYFERREEEESAKRQAPK